MLGPPQGGSGRGPWSGPTRVTLLGRWDELNVFDQASPSAGFPLLTGPSNGANVVARAITLITPAQLTAASVAEWLHALSAADRFAVLSRSVERPTHYKWFLGGEQRRYAVWIHEYKAFSSSPKGLGSFANTTHDHRYSFTSRILRGALEINDYAVEHASKTPNLSITRTLRAGETFTVSTDDVHSVTFSEPGTCTLIVQGPQVRSYSTVYDLDAGTATRVFDLEARFPELVDKLTVTQPR